MIRFNKIWIVIVLLILASLACSLSAADRSEPAGKSSRGEAMTTENALPTPLPATLAPPPTPVPGGIVVEADAEEQLLINIYERANPAVVNINVAANILGEELSDFGSGSGFVIDKQGHIVTNNHVIEDADQVRVTFADDRVVSADVVARDEDSDLAVLKVDVDPEQLFPLEFGDSSGLRVGQRVVAIGNPWELGGTMTVGIVSALGRSLIGRQALGGGSYHIPDVIQTDAAINPGNSGGPLLDSNGRVVGVNTAIRSEGRANSGVGFAVPANIVKRIVPALISEGRYRYPYLGISADQVTVGDLAEELDLPVQRGVLIATITSDGPADQAGLRGGTDSISFYGLPVRTGGDIIIAIDDYSVRDFDDLIAYLVRETSVGQQVALTILRGGETLMVPLILGERPYENN
jgi:S1-C subfamily serine protease